MFIADPTRKHHHLPQKVDGIEVMVVVPATAKALTEKAVAEIEAEEVATIPVTPWI